MASRSASPVEVQVQGRSLQLKTTEPGPLEQAADFVNRRLKELSLEKPLAKPSDLQVLLLLELAMERDETREKLKALLKQSDKLLE